MDCVLWIEFALNESPASLVGCSFYTFGHGHWGMAEELPPMLMRHGGADALAAPLLSYQRAVGRRPFSDDVVVDFRAPGDGLAGRGVGM